MYNVKHARVVLFVKKSPENAVNTFCRLPDHVNEEKISETSPHCVTPVT